MNPKSGHDGFSTSNVSGKHHDKSQKSQVNTLIYAMGDEADGILGSLDLTDEQKLKYGTIQEAFQNHFMK